MSCKVCDQNLLEHPSGNGQDRNLILHEKEGPGSGYPLCDCLGGWFLPLLFWNEFWRLASI